MREGLAYPLNLFPVVIIAYNIMFVKNNFIFNERHNFFAVILNLFIIEWYNYFKIVFN